MTDLTEEVAEKYKTLFKDCIFNFEGLKERTKQGFVQLVKGMGAEVSENAPYTFVQKSYFEKKKNKMKSNLFDINYIVDAVENLDSTILPNYAFVPPCNSQLSQDEPMCYAAQYIYKTDSCHKCYYENSFCKKCIESNEQSEEPINQRSISVVATDSSSDSEEEIIESRNKKFENNVHNSSKIIISSELEQQNKEQNKSSLEKESPPCKKMKTSNDLDDILYEDKPPEIDDKSDNSKDDTNSVNSSCKEQAEESLRNCFAKRHNEVKQQLVTRKKCDAGSIDESDNPSISEQNKTPLIDDKGSGWIISSKSAVPLEKIEAAEELNSDSTSDVEIATDVEDAEYFRKHSWWLLHDIPEKQRCTIPSCTFEPGIHPSHYLPRKFLSLVEKKILVKYLIIKDAINSAKGKAVYLNMIADGYLTHRSDETLRNCFRRTILKEIRSYKLDPHILVQFKALFDKSVPLH